MKYSESNPLPLLVAAKGIMATVAGTMTQGTSIELDLAGGDALGSFQLKGDKASFLSPKGEEMGLTPAITSHIKSFLLAQSPEKLGNLAAMAQSLQTSGEANVPPVTQVVKVMDSIRSMLG